MVLGFGPTDWICLIEARKVILPAKGFPPAPFAWPLAVFVSMAIPGPPVQTSVHVRLAADAATGNWAHSVVASELPTPRAFARRLVQPEVGCLTVPSELTAYWAEVGYVRPWLLFFVARMFLPLGSESLGATPRLFLAAAWASATAATWFHST